MTVSNARTGATSSAARCGYTARLARDYAAGETYYWEPGHNLEAVTDAEYVEITRSEDYDTLLAHCKRAMSG